MTQEEFESFITDVLDELPPGVLAALESFPIIAEDHLTEEIRKELGLPNGVSALGSCMRSGLGGQTLIYLFKQEIEAHPKQDKRKVIRDTLMHELEHSLGLPVKH